jgi:hypothetical protein
MRRHKHTPKSQKFASFFFFFFFFFLFSSFFLKNMSAGGEFFEFVAVTERDHHGDVSVAWAFPAKPDDAIMASIVAGAEIDVAPAGGSPASVSV